MPAGLEVTCALPEPENATLSAQGPTNPAVTAFAASMKMVQEFANPLQAPLQPLNALPLFALAVSVIWVRAGKVAVQLPDGQLIPEGVEVTVPPPLTVTATGLAKSAATDV